MLALLKLVPESLEKSRFELYKNVDAAYYGYRDEDDDGELLKYEAKVQEKRKYIYNLYITLQYLDSIESTIY